MRQSLNIGGYVLRFNVRSTPTPRACARAAARELPAWRDDVACQALLASFGAILPLRQPSDLHHPKLQTRILSLCDGVTIRICRLLEAAAIRAITTGRDGIDLELLTDDLATSSLVSIADRRCADPRADPQGVAPCICTTSLTRFRLPRLRARGVGCRTSRVRASLVCFY